MTLDIFFFWTFSALVLGGGALTVLARNPVHAAVALIVSLLGTAGLFLAQQAEFLFAVQIILYIGGIMVLFLFVIMLVNLDMQARQRQFSGQRWIAFALVAVIAAEVAYVWRMEPLRLPVPAASAVTSPGNTEQLADLLFQSYLVPFEVASLLLLAAIVGSVLMARGGSAGAERPGAAAATGETVR